MNEQASPHPTIESPDPPRTASPRLRSLAGRQATPDRSTSRTHATRAQLRLATRLPASGNAALAASALVQGALGTEFTLAWLDKVSDATYVADFQTFVRANPGAQ